MKIWLIAVSLLIATLTLSSCFSDETTEEQPTAKAESLTDTHPLAVAKQQLAKAREQYQKDADAEQVNQHLQAASEALQGHQNNKEALALSQEINLLKEENSGSSDEYEGAILRLWHRSSALVAREIEQVTQSWHDSSVANQTLRHLMDARMHFNYAEHDLFSNHNIEQARQDIKITLSYLEEARGIANPQLRAGIETLIQDIQQLPNNQDKAEEAQKIIQALDVASQSIVREVSHSDNVEIRARSEKIAADINQLKTDIFTLEKRQQYDNIMEKLQALDKLL